MAISKRQAVHWMFDVAVVIKAVNGVLEIAGGYFLMFKPGWIGPTVASWAEALLVHHPANWLAQTVARWGGSLTVDTEHFASVSRRIEFGMRSGLAGRLVCLFKGIGRHVHDMGTGPMRSATCSLQLSGVGSGIIRRQRCT
jgi:hypothetical protein